jgi:DNA-binding NtrC family response regulator
LVTGSFSNASNDPSRDTSIRRGTLHRLAAYPWPGNVRELEAVLEEAMLLRGRGWLCAEDLALPGAAVAADGAAPASTPARHARPAETRRRLALELAAVDAGVSTGRLARAAGVGLALARRELGALVAEGALRRTGAGRAVRYVRP